MPVLWKQWQILFSWAPKSLGTVTTVTKLNDACSLKVNLWQTNCVKKQSYQVHIVKAMVFPSSHIWIWELDHKEGWELKNWYFQTVVLGKTLESPLDYKEIKPVIPKGNQPWIFTGRIAAKTEALILWPPDAKSQLIGKDPDARQDWRQNKKVLPENEMVR